MKWWPLLAALPFAALGAAIGALSWIGAERGIHPRAGAQQYTPENVGLAVETVAFESLDGTRLSGWFAAGTLNRAVVLAHGYGSVREEMLPHAAFLHDAGYSVLLFDFRHMGRSEGRAVTIGALERLDILGAVRYLRARPETASAAIAVAGVSMGASAALLAAAESRQIAAIVAECGFKDIPSVIAQSFRYFVGVPAFPCAPITVWLAERRLGIRARDVRPEAAIARLQGCPVLLIHGLDDVLIDPSNSHALHRAAHGPAELWLVEGAAHAKAFQAAPAAYRERVLSFLDQALSSAAGAGPIAACE